MEAIKTKGIAHNGTLTIPIPQAFEEQELEIIILSAQSQGQTTNAAVHASKVKKLMSIVGKAKFPDTSSDNLNEYDQ